MEDENLLEVFEKITRESDRVVVASDDERVALVRRLYQVLKRNVIGAEVELELFKPFPNMGYIRIEGRRAVFKDTVLFAEIAKCADNFNVYGLTNGNIHADFTFYKLSTPVKADD